jgi:hypothetical protein
MASPRFRQKHGVTIIPSKEASWLVCDKMVSGELDFAHALWHGVACTWANLGLKRHGRADDPEQQRPGHHAEQVTDKGRWIPAWPR